MFVFLVHRLLKLVCICTKQCVVLWLVHHLDPLNNYWTEVSDTATLNRPLFAGKVKHFLICNVELKINDFFIVKIVIISGKVASVIVHLPCTSRVNIFQRHCYLLPVRELECWLRQQKRLKKLVIEKS